MLKDNKKIVIFVYDFPHKKSLTGLQIIKNSSFNNVFVISSPWQKLNFRRSKNRIAVIEDEILNPTDIAKKYGWETFVALHNSEEALNFYNEIKPDYGIILGARILSKDVINSFSQGIINFHPGILPNNRALDTIKWAIYHKIPQGVTAHMIDERIDVGKKIYGETIDVDLDDTIYDLSSKLFYLEMKLLNKVLNQDFNFPKLESLDSKYPAQKAVSDEIDNKILEDYSEYKKNYKKIVNSFEKD